MRLARLDLTRYGKFTGGSLNFGERQPGRPDLHLIYGPNEAGKSTAFSAFLDLLFGIEAQSDYAFLHPYKAMKIGGALEIGGAPPRTFGRIKRPQHSLLDAADQPLGEATLLGGFGGLDRTAYRNMFSLDDETLEKGGQAIATSKGNLGQLLFAASAGLAELSGILEGLRAEADTFYRGRARSELSELKTQLDRLKSERDALDTVLPAYKKLVDISEASRTRYEHELAELRALRKRANAVERTLQALPRHARLLALRARLQPMSDLPHPPAGWSDELPTLQRESIELATQLAGCEADIATLAAARDGVDVDAAALRLGGRIDELGADPRARFLTAEKDLPERRRSLADHDTAIAKLLLRLERADEPDPDRLVLGASVLGALRNLIEQRSGVEAQLETARRQHADAEQVLAEAEMALAATGGAEVGAASLAHLKTLLGVLRGADHPLRRRQAEKARATLSDKLTARLAALRPWTGAVEGLAAGAVPRPADIAKWKKAEADLAETSLRLDAEVERLTAERLRLQAEQEAAGRCAGLVSDAEAAAIRTRREQTWAAHRRDLRPETADSFEAALRQDDLVMAARLTRETELARLRQVGLDLAKTDSALAQAARDQAAAGGGRAGLAAAIDAAVQALGFAAGPRLSAVELEAWLAVRADCLDLRDRLRDEERAIESADADAQEARDRIAATLAVAGEPQPPDAPFAKVMARAEALVDRDSTLSGLRTRLADGRSSLAKRARERASAVAADAAWAAAWTRACESCWLGEGGTVPPLATVREVLTALAELGPWLEKRAALALRISKMEDDQTHFAREADRVAGEIGSENAAGSPLDRATALVARLGTARSAEARRNELSARLLDLDGRRATIRQALAVHGQRAAIMTAFFGVGSLTEVAPCLDQARERAATVAAAAELEHEIVAALGSASLAEAEAVLASADHAALEAERDDLKPRLDDLDQRARQLFAESTKAGDAVAAVGGDDAVARIAETRRTVLLQTEDKAVRYLRLRIGIAAAEQALQAYRDQHRSSMMSRASDAFRTISRGAYSGLAAQPGDKGEVLVALGAGSSKEASQLSKGTRFQLYLALRVAGYYEYCLRSEPVPFVADDIMETFDDFRAEEAFRLFAEMAQVGQVIYLTHHRHLCEIACSVCPDVRVTELPAAA